MAPSPLSLFFSLTAEREKEEEVEKNGGRETYRQSDNYKTIQLNLYFWTIGRVQFYRNGPNMGCKKYFDFRFELSWFGYWVTREIF